MDDLTRLAEIRERIVASRRKALYREVAAQLFEGDGDVTREAIETRFAELWVEPSQSELDALVAAKVRAGAENTALALEIALEGDRRSKQKVAKIEALLAAAKADAADLASVEIARTEHEIFQALIATAEGVVASPPGAPRSAQAGPASSSGKVN